MMNLSQLLWAEPMGHKMMKMKHLNTQKAVAVQKRKLKEKLVKMQVLIPTIPLKMLQSMLVLIAMIIMSTKTGTGPGRTRSKLILRLHLLKVRAHLFWRYSQRLSTTCLVLSSSILSYNNMLIFFDFFYAFLSRDDNNTRRVN